MSPRWQKIVPVCASARSLHRHRPAADSRCLRLWLLPCTRTSTRNDHARAGKLSTQDHYRTMQHSRNAHYTSRQLYKQTVNYCVSQMGFQNKIRILYSQKSRRTKLSRFHKMETPARFLMLCVRLPSVPADLPRGGAGADPAPLAGRGARHPRVLRAGAARAARGLAGAPPPLPRAVPRAGAGRR